MTDVGLSLALLPTFRTYVPLRLPDVLCYRSDSSVEIPNMADEAKPKRAPGTRPDRVRLVVLVYRQKGLSIEDFQNAWYVDSCDLCRSKGVN